MENNRRQSLIEYI